MTTTPIDSARLSAFRSPAALRVLWRCYGYLRPYWPIVAGAYAAIFLITGLNILIPQLIRGIVDDGLRAGDLHYITWAVLALLGLAAGRGLVTYFQQRWLEVASQSVAYDLRNDLQTKLTDLSFSYHDRAAAGQLLSRAIQDVERIRFLTGRATFRVADGVVLLVGTAVLLVVMSPSLALLVLLTLPFLAWRGLAYAGQSRPLSLAIQDSLGVVTTQLEQNLRGIRVVKAFAQSPAEIERFDRVNEAWFKLSAQSVRLDAANLPLLDLIVNVGSLLILIFGGWQVIQGRLTLGELVAFTTYLAQLAGPVRTMSRVIPAIAMAGAAGGRIFGVLDALPEVRDLPGAVALPPLQGRVRFEHVSLAYEVGLPTGRSRPAVSDISFEAAPGQVIALLGSTGAGKSTLTYLISRFYDPTSGRVTIDGCDLRTVTRASLRRQIGVVLQETVLFAASIRENIAFGRPAASEAEIVAAAQAAQAHDFILSFPAGYDTRVGEKGVTLSGGQKQRLAIARALLTDPRILILDDATASVDTETERLIQQALDRLMQGRTTFVIAHRLSTLRRADLILVLEHGRLVARGRHDTLLTASPLYAALYARQQQLDIDHRHTSGVGEAA
ncbi:MAG: ABC transporter ATP-binding protein [Anaerolineales bacterium]|nr:ABC transporter ATP-binding protein [Anaerolineales bacterium]